MIEFRGAGPAEFVELLDTVLDIYTAAMRPPADQINGRKAIMRNHATYPRFQCYFAELRDLSPQATPLRGSVSLPPAPRQGARLVRGSEGGVERFDPRTRIVAFAYGFHGAAGQWWHDVVFRALDERAGRGAAEVWMGDAFELAEIHVHPDFQGKGVGRAMINTLCAGRTERTGVLSTHDQPTAARHLYRSMGFTDLLSQFVFPGGYEHYAIVGRPLPLG